MHVSVYAYAYARIMTVFMRVYEFRAFMFACMCLCVLVRGCESICAATFSLISSSSCFWTLFSSIVRDTTRSSNHTTWYMHTSLLLRHSNSARFAQTALLVELDRAVVMMYTRAVSNEYLLLGIEGASQGADKVNALHGFWLT
jgi:hypothetical protein